MSVDATNATYRAFRELAVLLPTVPPRRRPSLANAQVVALYLAHRYNPQKGYVDETIAQIEAATLVSNGTVRNALRALDEIGWWVVVSSGNRYQAARRVPGFIDVDRESDLAVKNTASDTYSASLTSRSNTDTQKPRARGSDTYSASYTPLEREPDLAHPRSTYHVTTINQSSSRSTPREDTDLATTWINQHIEHRRRDITNPAAMAKWLYPRVLEVIATARTLGHDPCYDLNEQWPIRPDQPWPEIPDALHPETPDYETLPETAVTRLHRKLGITT